MAPGQISGLSVAYVTGGLVLLWSGYRNDSVANTLRSLLKGQVPAANPTGPIQIGITSNGSGGSPGSLNPLSATGSQIADDALKYLGHPYLYGGAPGPSGNNPWDCSSFCNWVLGHDLGMALPGSSSPGYSGTVHGPTTLDYIGWSGASTIGNNPAQAQAGDLCVWQTHMGIATGSGKFVSAENPLNGTQVAEIANFIPGEILFVRRIKNVPGTGTPVPPGKITAVSG